MKSVVPVLVFFFAQLANSQSQWRPLGSDDFNKPTYGNTFISAQNGYDNNGGFKLCVKNGHVYSMNIELSTYYTANDHYVLGKYSNGKWEHIETPFWIGNRTLAGLYSFALDNNETPYLFFNDALNGNKATVKKFDGTTWLTVGNGALSTTAPFMFMEMAIGNDNLPVVIYAEGNTIQVKKFNGTDWITLPDSGMQGARKAVLKIDSNNLPYVLYSYSDIHYDDYSILKRFNGTNWEEIGITDFYGAASGLCFDSANHPYIALNRSSSIRKFDGSSWQTIAGPPAGGMTSYVLRDLTIDSDNNLCVIYAPDGYNRYVGKLVNGTWQYFGGYFCPNMSIVIDGNTLYEEHVIPPNLPVVNKRVGTAWEMLGDEIVKGTPGPIFIHNDVPINAIKNPNGTLAVREFVSGTWSNVGGASVADQSVSDFGMDTDSNGTAYVAYITSSKITVRKRAAGWQLVGPANFSAAADTYMDFKINHQNVPYVVYKSGRVQKFNGTSWEFVGSSFFTGEKDVELAFDNNDVPYVFYLDSGPKIVRFNGTFWEEVGASSLASFTSASAPQIVCDSNNTILIGFISANKSIQVLKWNGNAWASITNQTITTETFMNLTLDKNDAPVVIFNKNYNNFRNLLNVNRFNGTNWEAAGTPDFSASEVYSGTIAFNHANIPIVVYNSEAIYSKYYGEEGSALSIVNNQSTNNEHLTIYPNPVKNTFSLNIEEEICNVDLFDSSGKKVFSGSGKKDLDISSLQTGLYLIKVKTDTNSYTGKVIKN